MGKKRQMILTWWIDCRWTGCYSHARYRTSRVSRRMEPMQGDCGFDVVVVNIVVVEVPGRKLRHIAVARTAAAATKEEGRGTAVSAAAADRAAAGRRNIGVDA